MFKSINEFKITDLIINSRIDSLYYWNIYEKLETLRIDLNRIKKKTDIFIDIGIVMQKTVVGSFYFFLTRPLHATRFKKYAIKPFILMVEIKFNFNCFNIYMYFACLLYS